VLTYGGAKIFLAEKIAAIVPSWDGKHAGAICSLLCVM